jgi:hypothetical protein
MFVTDNAGGLQYQIQTTSTSGAFANAAEQDALRSNHKTALHLPLRDIET